jgi:hypothetical protein
MCPPKPSPAPLQDSTNWAALSAGALIDPKYHNLALKMVDERSADYLLARTLLREHVPDGPSKWQVGIDLNNYLRWAGTLELRVGHPDSMAF